MTVPFLLLLRQDAKLAPFDMDHFWDLEIELSQELNKRSPALAQVFTHVDLAAAGQAWRLQVGAVTPAKRSQRKTFLRDGLDLTQIVPPDFTMCRKHKAMRSVVGSSLPVA